MLVSQIIRYHSHECSPARTEKKGGVCGGYLHWSPVQVRPSAPQCCSDQTRDTSLPLPEELELVLVADVVEAGLDQVVDLVGGSGHLADVVVRVLQVDQLGVQQGVLEPLVAE